MVVLVNFKNEADPIKSGHKIFPIIPLWELYVAMETRVRIQSGQNPIALQIKFGCDRPTGCRDIHV